MPRTDDTSREIRRVALEMFATTGYDAASIRDIAAAVGIRGASMYHHFSSKEEILWDLTESALLDIAKSWRSARESALGGEPIDLLRSFVRSGIIYHAEHRTEAILVNGQQHRLAPEHHRAAVALRFAYQQDLTEIVEACITTRQHNVPDVRVTVFAILQMMIAIAGWYRPDGPNTVDEIADFYEELATKMLVPWPGSIDGP